MPEDGRNIYKTCREPAGYTQEHAAELEHRTRVFAGARPAAGRGT